MTAKETIDRKSPAAWRWQLPGLLLLAGLAVGAWAWSQALVQRQALAEARTVADLAENVGRWASQYGGVHVKTVGVQQKIPGNFLTRTSYTLTADEVALVSSAQPADPKRLQHYHWKNPALVQRELADVVGASGSKASFRLTASTVLNTNNAPSEFERRALGVLKSTPSATEYWEVNGQRLFYGRAVVAQDSCMRCHDKPETAPDFLRTNVAFNGGGGFGYEVGKPAGLISVTLPVDDSLRGLRQHLPPTAWVALGLSGVGALGVLVALVSARRRS